MRVQVEAKHIYYLHRLRYFMMRELTKEQELVLTLSDLVLVPNLEDSSDIAFIPEWQEFDFVISHYTIEVYWGDILLRRIEPYDSAVIHCFFEQCNSVTLTEPMIDILIDCSRYFILNPPKDICVPVRMLWD